MSASVPPSLPPRRLTLKRAPLFWTWAICALLVIAGHFALDAQEALLAGDGDAVLKEHEIVRYRGVLVALHQPLGFVFSVWFCLLFVGVSEK
ncbi:MAG: hypothetical protein KAI24_26105 [Planctomycetes bacterium]|nr:hypothetical protein [Planctomycetota bacterium]